MPDNKHLLVLLQLDEFQVLPVALLQELLRAIGDSTSMRPFDGRVCLITMLTGTSSASRATEIITPSKMHPINKLLTSLSEEDATSEFNDQQLQQHLIHFPLKVVAQSMLPDLSTEVKKYFSMALETTGFVPRFIEQLLGEFKDKEKKNPYVLQAFLPSSFCFRQHLIDKLIALSYPLRLSFHLSHWFSTLFSDVVIRVKNAYGTETWNAYVGGNEEGIVRFSLWALSQRLCQLSDKVNGVTVQQVQGNNVH